MCRRGHKVFCIIFFVVYFSLHRVSPVVFAEESVEKFLTVPLASSVRLLQGWYYTVVVNGNKNHGAIDYDCEIGEPVYAAFDGVAMSSVQLDLLIQRGYGNFVLIRHENGYATLYGHLDTTADTITHYSTEKRNNTNYTEWTKVKTGDYIGTCGASGTDNVHLHFEVTKGAYSTGRVDSYDLYQTKQFYPPNTSYRGMGEKHLWLNDPPQPMMVESVEKNTNHTHASTIWNGIKNIFVSTEHPAEVAYGVSQEKDTVSELGVSFHEKKFNVTSTPHTEVTVTVRAKNSGKTAWKKNTVSLNIVGGRKVSAVFRHPSWVTDLRPALLDQTVVEAGESGTFTFTISGLDEGEYVIPCMVVEVGTWKQIGDEVVEIMLSVSPEHTDEAVNTEKVSVIGGLVRGIKEIAETVVDTVVDVITRVPRIFGGGRGSRSSPNESTQTVIEDAVENPPIKEDEHSPIGEVVEGGGGVEIENVPDIRQEIMFNEVAWSGSSGICADREWIEIYNASSTAYSLENWTLDIHEFEATSTLTLAGSIGGNSYYLISHTDIFSTFVTPDMELPQYIHIPDGGARLILKNQDGEIVDEIDQANGWLAGDSGQFPHTLERGVGTSTWNTSDSVRYGVHSGNCGQITGSPGMANNGYAFISDETIGFYPRNSEGNVVFLQEENPHLFSSITIAENESVHVGAGVVFVGVSPESRINVQGELILKGNEHDPIILTSRYDQEIVVTSTLFSNIFTSGVAQPGDWQNIEVGEGGTLTIEHGVLKYGGNRFGTSAFCQGCSRSQVITNLGGDVVLQDVDIGNGFELGSGAGPDTLVYSNGGTVYLKNIQFHHGKRALHSGGKTEVQATSVKINDFDVLDKVVYFEEKMPSTWEDIQFLENSPSYAYSPTLIVTSSYTLTPHHRFEFSTVFVTSGAHLILDGGNVYAREIKIQGTLSGGENGNVSEIAGGASSSSTFSHILFLPGSSGDLSHVKIRGGGYFQSISGYPFSSSRPYMIWIDGATVSISHSQLIDARRPGGIMVVRNGSVDVRDTEMGWNTSYNKLSNFLDYGLVLNTQSVGYIENVNFKKMDYVVESNQGSVVTHNRMSRENFFDLYPVFFPNKNWFPQNLFSW